MNINPNLISPPKWRRIMPKRYYTKEHVQEVIKRKLEGWTALKIAKVLTAQNIAQLEIDNKITPTQADKLYSLNKKRVQKETKKHIHIEFLKIIKNDDIELNKIIITKGRIQYICETKMYKELNEIYKREYYQEKAREMLKGEQ